MKKIGRSLVAAFVVLTTIGAAGVAAAASAPAATSAPASTSTSTATWSSLEQAALQATAGYRDTGPLTVVGTPSAAISSTVATPSGELSVAQRSLVATNATGTVDMVLALLGGSQLVVNEVGQTSSEPGAALVLRPGTSQIAGAYPLTKTSTATTTAAGPAHTIRTVDALAHDGALRHRPAHLDTTGGCYPAPSYPVVVTTGFGPLIDGLGGVRCLQYETMGLIVSVYHLGTREGTPNSGSGGGYYLGVNAYAFCYHITGWHAFRTTQLWSVNGVLQGGATSSYNTLHCT